MKNIVLLDTSIGSLNQGDEIINVSIKNNWKELFDENYIIRLATHTPMYTKFQSVIYKKKLSVIQNGDFKFLCGTNALYTNMFRPLPTWNINLINYKLAKDTICLGVGIGVNSKNVNFYTKTLYDKVLSHDYIHSTRDDKTANFLKQLGFKAINTGCPTLWGLNEEHCRNIPKSKAKDVVFTLTYYSKDRENDKRMIEILCDNYEICYFWPQCINDLEYFNSLNIQKPIKVISPNLESYKSILTEKNVDYVGNRLHGGIFALQHQRRSIIIAIDYRAIEMNRSYSFECIERKLIPKLLENKIKMDWTTRISGIDFDLIKEWRRQFINEE
ncbi:polysaccharide pyruvyl transferase family protein [Eubacterium limosum]|uniref:polysaccharide pyruvyl transferase family protein n=1 Tax=Eubacterium limosum TaxID=1736 RepID=UPI00370FBC80